MYIELHTFYLNHVGKGQSSMEVRLENHTVSDYSWVKDDMGKPICPYNMPQNTVVNITNWMGQHVLHDNQCHLCND